VTAEAMTGKLSNRCCAMCSHGSIAICVVWSGRIMRMTYFKTF
jgi:hypothetical protein